MPTYSYRCKQCGDVFDVRQHITDDPLKVCEKCGGALVKIINSVGITFKGSGFYRTDAHKASQSSSSASAASAGSTSGESSGGTETKAAASAPGRQG